eukprot:3344059-Rhodomonas_salina.1
MQSESPALQHPPIVLYNVPHLNTARVYRPTSLLCDVRYQRSIFRCQDLSRQALTWYEESSKASISRDHTRGAFTGTTKYGEADRTPHHARITHTTANGPQPTSLALFHDPQH